MDMCKNKLAILFAFLCGTCLGEKVISNRPPAIYLQPAFNVYYKYGESVYMPCRADGVPRPTYRWKRNGIDLKLNGSDNKFVQLYDEGTIVINEPEDKDEGIFQCIAENNFGTSVSINVNFSFPPAFVEWVLRNSDGMVEPINYNNRITIDLEGRLYITNVQENDYKDYKDGKAYLCMVVNLFMRRNRYDKAHYIIPSGSSPVKRPAEYLWASPSDQLGLRGETFKLKCIFSGNPTPVVFWLKNKETIPDRYEVSLGGQELTIPELTEDDAGPYECYGTNSQGPKAYRNFVIRVESKPYWDVQPHDVETSVGASVTFLCKAKGYPDPKIAWLINGVKLEESKVSILQSDRYMKPDANNITFVNLNKNDHMVIQCNASNVHGYVFADVYLIILEVEPSIIVPPARELKVAESRDAELTCITYGKPDPIITWRKEGEQITGGRYHIQPNGNLHIQGVVLSDAGNYTCHAYNKYNFIEAWGILIVRDKTRIVQKPRGLEVTAGSDATFSCLGTTDSAEINNLYISWLKDNKPIMTMTQHSEENNTLIISGTIVRDSGTYTCVVSNGLDNATAEAILTVKDKPDPPIEVTLVECDEKEAGIGWTKGASNNAPIQYFMIQYNTSFSPDEWFIGASNVSATQDIGFVHLSPWVEYNFRVLAVNKIGVSEPSYHTEKVCKTNEDRPYKNPEEVRTIGDKRNYLTIEWKPMPPIEHNGPQFKYVLEIKRIKRKGQRFNLHEGFIFSDWKKNHFEYRTNDIFVPYFITVKATNEVGDSSAPVQEHQGFSAEGNPTITVSALSVDSVVTSSSVTFYWNWDDSLNTPQAGTPVNGIFHGFKIQYWVRGQKEQTFQEAEVRVSDMVLRYARRKKRAIQSYKYTLDGLLGNTNYEAQMRVINTYYAGPPSAIVLFKTE